MWTLTNWVELGGVSDSALKMVDQHWVIEKQLVYERSVPAYQSVDTVVR